MIFGLIQVLRGDLGKVSDIVLSGKGGIEEGHIIHDALGICFDGNLRGLQVSGDLTNGGLDLAVQSRGIEIHIDLKFFTVQLFMQALKIQNRLHIDGSIIVTQLISSFQGCIKKKVMQGKSDGWRVTFGCVSAYAGSVDSR